MGSYNQVCNISSLTVKENDPCLIILGVIAYFIWSAANEVNETIDETKTEVKHQYKRAGKYLNGVYEDVKGDSILKEGLQDKIKSAKDSITEDIKGGYNLIKQGLKNRVKKEFQEEYV